MSDLQTNGDNLTLFAQKIAITTAIEGLALLVLSKWACKTVAWHQDLPLPCWKAMLQHFRRTFLALG